MPAMTTRLTGDGTLLELDELLELEELLLELKARLELDGLDELLEELGLDELLDPGDPNELDELLESRGLLELLKLLPPLGADDDELPRLRALLELLELLYGGRPLLLDDDEGGAEGRPGPHGCELGTHGLAQGAQPGG
jgi:hypothetical protein